MFDTFDIPFKSVCMCTSDDQLNRWYLEYQATLQAVLDGVSVSSEYANIASVNIGVVRTELLRRAL